MAGSIATIVALWISLQSMGFLGQTNTIGAHKLPVTVQNYLSTVVSITGHPLDERHRILADVSTYGDRKQPQLEENALNVSLNFATETLNRIGRLEANIIFAGVDLSPNSPAFNQFVHLYPTKDAAEKGIDAIIASKASLWLAQRHCLGVRQNTEECARFVSSLKFEGTQFEDKCASQQKASCNTRSKYRTIDGSCNNLDNPKWGSSMTAYARVLFPKYFDGIKEPRHAVRGRNLMPNPREVSVALCYQNDQSDVQKTMAVMQWSQFIAHDMAHTPVRKMVTLDKPITCCKSTGSQLLPRHIHPDCDQITVSEDDPVYGVHEVTCLDYVRSLTVLKSDCSFGPMEQMNQVSHFLDGSTIYGSTLKKSRELRSFEGGKLLVKVKNNTEYLPSADEDSDIDCPSKDNCYDAGDLRVNSEPQLAVMHTLWAREHNKIAHRLAKINPNWSDETLYQEARRIVIAEIQFITYTEWLPLLLGKDYAEFAGLSNNNDRKYNPHDDPAVTNEAATAALRFVNSLKQGHISMPDEARKVNESMQLSDNFYNPRFIESEDVFNGLIRGLATQTVQKMDANLVSDISNKLYKTDLSKLGFDVISFDIQRGRDHGLPGYNYYRKYCDLPMAKDFDDFLDHIPSETVKKLRVLYDHVDDVDLVIGGMSERPAEDGIVGPTFRCIISEQFARTLRTDRFFYDLPQQPHPFTQEQLAAIRNVSLARIFCDNSNGNLRMQPNAFLKAQVGNEIRPCDDFEKIPSVDLFAWAEKAKAYR